MSSRGRSEGKDPFTGEFLTRRLQHYSPQLNKAIGLRYANSYRRMNELGTGPGGYLMEGNRIDKISAWGQPASGSRPDVLVLNEEAERGRAVILKGPQWGFYLHVDDGVCMAGGPSAARDASSLMHTLADGLEDKGFIVSDRTEPSEVKKLVGYSRSPTPARLEAPILKACLIDEALRFMADHHSVDTLLLRRVTSIWIWYALPRRDLLSIPSALFTFLDTHVDVVVEWWPSARGDARHAACGQLHEC